MSDQPPRTAAYAKDPDYEAVVSALNSALGGLPRARVPLTRPVLFITGQPRSGTTLLYSALAASKAFGYPSNLVARFFARPEIGVQVQRLAAPFLPEPSFSFESRAGNTRQWCEPHEFGYFWERHFPFSEHHQPDLDAWDGKALIDDFGALQAELGAPLLFKNLILAFVLERLIGELPEVRVVRVRRPALEVACSLVRTREEFHGSREPWFSVRPRDYALHLGAPVAAQVAHQMACIESALSAARRSAGEARWIELEYDEVCARPREVAMRCIELCGVTPGALDLVPASFARRSRLGLPDAEIEAIRRELAARGL